MPRRSGGRHRGTPALDPLEYLVSLEQLGMKFGLESIRRICQALENPQDAFQSVLIAGTNGKGSVTAMVDQALCSAGRITGRYTSPHLVRLEERFCINGRPVAPDSMRRAAGRVQQAIERLRDDRTLETHPTFFEATTAMAFDLFREAGVELAVLEVGLGGRLDSTNIVSPVATAITTIALDHQAVLGSTLAEIAFEKAGIVKPGIPLVLGGGIPAEAVDVIRQVCRERKAPLCEVDAEVRIEAAGRPQDGRPEVSLRTPVGTYGPLRLALRGRHQVANAAIAVRLLESVRPTGAHGVAGLEITPAAIEAGLTQVQWPGRIDLVRLSPDRAVLLDSAHNPAGAVALAAYLRETESGRLPIVFGAMKDKDVAGMLTALAPRASVFVVTSAGRPRAMPPQKLAALAARYVPEIPVLAVPDPRAALESAWKLAGLVCACGSIFLVGSLLEVLTRPARPTSRAR